MPLNGSILNIPTVEHSVHELADDAFQAPASQFQYRLES